MRQNVFRFLAITLCLALKFAPASGWQSAASEEQRLVRIQQLIQQGDLRGARSELQNALERLPGDPRLENLLGVVEAQERHFTAAESNFRRAIQKAPRFTDAYLNLGRLYQEDFKEDPRASEKALEVYRKLLDFDPDHVEANYQAAWLLNRLGVFAASLQHLARLPAAAQQRPQALALRCANYAALGKAAQADVAAQQLLSRDDLAEMDVLPIVPMLAAHQAGNLAVRLLEALARRGLGSGQAFEQLSLIYETQGRLKEAREALEKAARVERPSARLLFRLAQLSYQAGDREGTLGYLAHARDVEPGNAAVHFFFGMVCVELNLPREAKQSLKEAVQLDPNNAYYNYALGAVLVQEKNADQAIPYFRKYREARPGDAHGRFALGVAYFYAYELEPARRELQAVAGRPETRMGAHLFLGRMAIREGNLAEAVEHLQHAIQANPSVPEPHAELGLVYVRRKEYALAEKSLARAVQLAPNHYLGNLYLLMLYQRTKDSRAEAQAQRVEQIQKAGEEKERLLLRSLEIRPY